MLAAWAASIFIDVDHYLWFAVRNRRLDPVAAVRSFNSAQAPQNAETRLLHHPVFLLGLAAASTFAPVLRMPLLGMGFHVGLDTYHRARTRDAQAAARARDGSTCRVCGSRVDVIVHLWRQPRLLPSYRVDNFVCLCTRCHEVAHSDRGQAIAPMGTDWEDYLTGTGLRERLAVTSPR